jgi:hypothetical protein
MFLRKVWIFRQVYVAPKLRGTPQLTVDLLEKIYLQLPWGMLVHHDTIFTPSALDLWLTAASTDSSSILCVGCMAAWVCVAASVATVLHSTSLVHGCQKPDLHRNPETNVLAVPYLRSQNSAATNSKRFATGQRTAAQLDGVLSSCKNSNALSLPVHQSYSTPVLHTTLIFIYVPAKIFRLLRIIDSLSFWLPVVGVTQMDEIHESWCRYAVACIIKRIGWL